MATLRITDDCIGCESCVETCPDVFTMDKKSNKAIVTAPDATTPCTDEAIDICPVEAIVRD